MLRGGVPFDVAESWPDEKRFAFCIILGKLDGGDWNWVDMRWNKRKTT